MRARIRVEGLDTCVRVELEALVIWVRVEGLGTWVRAG